MNKVFADDPIKGSVLSGMTDGVRFFKEVKRSKHYFRLMKGYAIQKEVIEKLLKLKIQEIRIIETDTGDTLVSKVEDWIEHGGIWTGKNGKQRTLSEKYMTIAPKMVLDESFTCCCAVDEPVGTVMRCPVCKENCVTEAGDA